MVKYPIILIEKHYRSIAQYCPKNNDTEIHLGSVLYFPLLNGIVFVIRGLSLSSNNQVPNTFSSRISFKEALHMAALLLGSSICSRDKPLSKTNGMFCAKPHSYSFSSSLCQKKNKQEDNVVKMDWKSQHSVLYTTSNGMKCT